MPLLFILGVGIAIGALFLGKAGPCETCDSWVGITYIYTPRWEALTNPSVWLAAAGQVFFSVGVGFAMYPVYASYYASSAGIRKAGAQAILANTLDRSRIRRPYCRTRNYCLPGLGDPSGLRRALDWDLK
jgi:NSS family neurotransmitter:Na+ symporter